MPETLPPEYFHRVYAANNDPWNFETSEYEAAKYKQTLATLTRPQYCHAFEIGCSIGVFTAILADRCEHLLSVDVSDVALRKARERCAGLVNVEFRKLAVPDEYPADSFDLTLISEVGYYLGAADLEKLGRLTQQHTNPEGELLLVHWTPSVPDYPQTGDQVHEYFFSLPEWNCVRQFREPQYRIELLRKRL